MLPEPSRQSGSSRAKMDILKDPIPVLVRRLAIPASVGFFFSTMYNVVDTYFAGMISTEALAALSLSFPIFFIIIALGTGISQGTTALIANALGADDRARAHLYLVQAFTFGAFLSVLLTVTGLLSAPTLFKILGARDQYLSISLEYMNVLLIGTVFIMIQSILNASLQARGDTRTYRNVLFLGFVLNLALDPWFLFGGFGMPALGIRGIALATVLIQLLSCIFLYFKVRNSPDWTPPKARQLAPNWRVFGEIAYQGFPAGINMATVAIGIFIITWFISRFSAEGVAAYGIATRIEQIVLLPTIGLNIAVLSLTGQNNGAGLHDRVKLTWHTTLQYGLIMMLVGGAAIFFGGRWAVGLFTADVEVIRIGGNYLRVAAVTLCSYVILFQTVFMLQGLKRPMIAIWIGVYRQILAPVLVFEWLAFGLGLGLAGLWWGIFGVTWSAALITFLYGRRVLNEAGRSAKEQGRDPA